MNLATIMTAAAALSDSTRLRLLLLLEERALPIGELAAALGICPSVGSFHLAKLAAVGLVTTTRRGRRVFVRRDERRWRRVCEGLGTP